MNKEEIIRQNEAKIAELKAKISKIKEIIAAEEELGIDTAFLERNIQDLEGEIAAIMQSEQEAIQEGEDRPLFIKYLQEGNAQGCADMVKGTVLDSLGALGAEQPLADFLATIVCHAVRVGIARYKYSNEDLKPTLMGVEK